MPNDNRPKRSWRDIDKMRDGGGGSRGPSSSSRPDAHQERDSKQYRAALEALFNKGPAAIGKLADKLAPPPMRGIAPSTDEEAEAPDTPNEGNHEAEAAPKEDAAKDGVAQQKVPSPAGGKKKPTEDRIQLRRKFMEAAGRHEITKAADKYLEKFPLPDDHEFLEQLLEHEQEERVFLAMDRIGQLLDRMQPPRRSRALCGKLRYLDETSGHEELRRRAQELLKRLG